MLSTLEWARRVGLLAAMLARDLRRRPLTMLILFIVPALFTAIVLATTKSQSIAVVLASLAETGAADAGSAKAKNPFYVDLLDNGLRTLDQQQLSLVFLGGAAVCFMTGFLAFYLVYRRTEADRRLVLAGYRPAQVLLAKLVVLLLVVVLLAVYETAAVALSVDTAHIGSLAVAFTLGGLVYGCLGLLVGAVVRHELEGIFILVLLTNVDVGWLQNPIYFAASAQQGVIEALPGHHPTQLAILSAFTGDFPTESVVTAVGWSGVVLALALTAFWLRIRPAAPRPLSDRAYFLGVMAVAYAMWIVTFYPVGWFAATLPTQDLTSAWDHAIPVVVEAVWIYELCYIFPLVGLIAVTNWHRINVAVLAIAISCLVAYPLYLVLPIAFPRPTLGDGLADVILATEYAADFSPGANKLPSLHVTFAWLITLACRGQRFGRVGDAILIGVATAISVSTLLVKQHIIIDVVAGVLLAITAYTVATWIYGRVVDADSDPRAGLRQMLDHRRWGVRLFGSAGYGGPVVRNGLLDVIPKGKSRIVARFQEQLLGVFGALGRVPTLARPVAALSRWLVGSFLYAIKLEVNRTCNLNCKMCYVRKSPETLPFETITDLLDQIRSCHVRLEILGGEPLLRDDIVEIVEYAKKKARLPFVSIYTNGLQVTPQLAAELKRAGLDAAIVTVTSHQAEVHDRFVGKQGAWGATTAGIRLLRDAGIDTYTFTAIHEENIDDVRLIHDFVNDELKVGPVFYPYIPQQKDDPLIVIDRTAWREIKHWLLYEKFPSHMQFIRDFYMLTGHACSGGNYVFTVKADGRVQPCPFIDDLPLGSIYEKKFWEIYATRFESPSFCDFKSVPDECQDCTYVSVCAGGCKAGNMELFGRYNCKDHRCLGPFRDPLDGDEVADRLPVFF